jgi:hypothetical protein
MIRVVFAALGDAIKNDKRKATVAPDAKAIPTI